MVIVQSRTYKELKKIRESIPTAREKEVSSKQEEIKQYKQDEKFRKFEQNKTLAGRQKMALARSYESAQLKYAKQGPAILRGRERIKAAPLGRRIAAAITSPQVMSESQFYGTSQSSGGGSGRGRGRPTGTYTYVIPGVGPVPIQAYKRYLSQQKSMARVQNELAKANMSMQPSANEMPQGYGQYSAEDAFAGQSGPDAMQQLQIQQMQQQMARQQVNPGQQPQQPGMFRRIFGGQQQQTGMNFAQRPPMSSSAGNQVARMGVWNQRRFTLDPSQNILNAPNVFNRQGETTIGVARRQQY